MPGQYWPHTWLNIVIAFSCAVEPSAVSLFLPPQPAVPVVPLMLGAAVPRWFSSLPQPVSAAAPSAVANAAAASAPPCLSSLTISLS